MELTFTSVFYEKNQIDAQKRLEKLRKLDDYPEIKAYIIPENGEWRVLRKILISSPTNGKKETRRR